MANSITLFLDYSWNGLTTLAFIIFLFSFIKLKEKTHGHYIILALNISDFSTVLNLMLTPFITNSTTNNILFALEVATFHFSINWTAAFALYSLLTLKHLTTFNSIKYIKTAAPVCLALALFHTVLYAIFKHRFI